MHRGGRARFRFARSPAGRTFLREQEVGYPFHVTRPFYLEGDPEGMPTLYLQSVSGGIYRDDAIELALEAGEGAAAHVTTQAATIAHAMTGGYASQRVVAIARDGALLEYLPDPLVLFPGARLESSVRVAAAESATALVCDSFLGHDPQGAGGVFDRLTTELRIERPDGALLSLDRIVLEGARLLVANGSGERPFSAHGALACVTTSRPADVLLGALNDAAQSVPGLYAGASELPGECGVWTRVLAEDSHALRAGLHAAWSALRRTLVGGAPRPRRK